MGGSRGLSRPAGTARGRFAHGREPVRVRRHQPADAVTVVELVDRERSRLQRLYVLAGAALAVGATCALLAVAASALGGARWIAMPKGMPFLVWVAVAVADVAVMVWTIRRLDRRATRQSVAAAIEREQLLRAGSLRGVIEVAESGALGRKAAAALSE